MMPEEHYASRVAKSGPHHRQLVTINPGRPSVREVLCRLRSYDGMSCVVGGLMSGGHIVGRSCVA